MLVVHEWWGHNEHARAQARRLAEAGYVAFALDMYGNGRVTSHPDAQAFMAEATADLAALGSRFAAARAQLEAGHGFKLSPKPGSEHPAPNTLRHGGLILCREVS